MALKKEEAVITEVLKMIAPGTPIRDGLENILKAKTGALIVIRRFKRSSRFSRWRIQI